jgi:hypothetical protein
MTTLIEVYNGHQLTAVEQPQGGWAAKIVAAGGGRQALADSSMAGAV